MFEMPDLMVFVFRKELGYILASLVGLILSYKMFEKAYIEKEAQLAKSRKAAVKGGAKVNKRYAPGLDERLLMNSIQIEFLISLVIAIFLSIGLLVSISPLVIYEDILGLELFVSSLILLTFAAIRYYSLTSRSTFIKYLQAKKNTVYLALMIPTGIIFLYIDNLGFRSFLLLLLACVFYFLEGGKLNKTVITHTVPLVLILLFFIFTINSIPYYSKPEKLLIVVEPYSISTIINSSLCSMYSIYPFNISIYNTYDKAVGIDKFAISYGNHTPLFRIKPIVIPPGGRAEISGYDDSNIIQGSRKIGNFSFGFECDMLTSDTKIILYTTEGVFIYHFPDQSHTR